MKSFSFLLWSAKIAFVDDEKCNLPNFSFFHEAKGLLSEGFTSAMNHYIYLPSGCRKMGGNLNLGFPHFSKHGAMTMSRFTYFDLDFNFTLPPKKLNCNYSCTYFLSKETEDTV